MVSLVGCGGGGLAGLANQGAGGAGGNQQNNVAAGVWVFSGLTLGGQNVDPKQTDVAHWELVLKNDGSAIETMIKNDGGQTVRNGKWTNTKNVEIKFDDGNSYTLSLNGNRMTLDTVQNDGQALQLFFDKK
ncbi:MAG: hypothetical protein HONBIEJF_02288 [Fimbriimonadaceae bacterium]|nr:hypothetical protein [Fimbriimonadaceae bacterium]